MINHSPRAAPSAAADWAAEAQGHRQMIDARLAALCPAFGASVPALGQAMAEATTAPGKRFRGVLMALLAARTGGVGPAVIEAACAVELVHTASLIVDDLPAMDGAVLRRGRATTHVAHGEGRAILAGIALLSEAFRLLAVIPGLAGETRSALVALLAEAVGPGGLCAGQDLDLHDAKTSGSITAEQDLKTGRLFEAALLMVARLQGCDAAQTAALASVSRVLGRVFQSYDDLLDIGPQAASASGKTAGLDRGAAGPDKGLLAVAGLDGAVRHYRGLRGDLDAALASLWFDAGGVRAYIHSVLPGDAAP